MPVDASNFLTLTKHDPVFLHVKAGMTVIVSNPVNQAWYMADVLEVNKGSHDTKTPLLFQVAEVDSGVISWINPERVTHIVPRL